MTTIKHTKGRTLSRKGFPQISSMPTFRSNGQNDRASDQTQHIAKRSIETENLGSLKSTSSPFSNRVNDASVKGSRNQIMISQSSESSENDGDEFQSKPDNLDDFHHLPVVLQYNSGIRCLENSHERSMNIPGSARIVNKAGDKNVGALYMPGRMAKFLKDIVHTMIDARWRYVLAVYISTYFICWTFFAVLFYLIGWAHGDFEFDPETGKRLGEGREECVRGGTSFAAFFLLSVESQVSTGYGEKYPTEECPEAIFLLIVQLTVGVMIDAALVGTLYAKMVRPPKYADFKFSRKAVICQRDGKLCLLFRVFDFKQAHSIDSKVRAYLFEEKITKEGEKSGNSQQRLKLENNGRVFLIWPNTVCHYIDDSSPFYDMSARDLIQRKFEIIVSLTGISKDTREMTQARTSYLSKEIFWGHRFTNLINYDPEKETYLTDVEKLDETIQVDTALCSAQRLSEVLEASKFIIANNSDPCFYEEFDRIADFDEDFDLDDENYSGLRMITTSKISKPDHSRKFNITKVEKET